jgi:hypothetical protein
VTSDPVDAWLPVGPVAAADQPGTTRGPETGQQRVGAAEGEAQFAAGLLGGDLAAVSPLKDLDTAIELAAVTDALLVVGGDAGGNRRLRSLRLLVGGGRGDEQLTINLCGGVVLAPVAGVGDNDADLRVDVGRPRGSCSPFRSSGGARCG